MADRSMASGVSAALDNSNVPLVVFCELDFASAPMRFTNCFRSLDWNGHTWMGAAGLGQIQPVEETSAPQSSSVAVRFSGIDPAFVAAIRDEHYAGRAARIWIAVYADDLSGPVDTPWLAFQGLMDEPEISIGDTAEIVLTLENRWRDFDRPRVRRMNDADQQAASPGDRFFEFVEQMESKELVWGSLHIPAGPTPPSMKKAKQFLVNPFIPQFNVVKNLFKKLF